MAFWGSKSLLGFLGHLRVQVDSLLSHVSGITVMQVTGDSVTHALKVRSAVYCDDIPAFFRLYRQAPAMGRALLDKYLPEFRFRALNIIVRAYRPTLPVSFVAELLGFSLGAGYVTHVHGRLAEDHAVTLPGCSAAAFVGKYMPKVTAWATQRLLLPICIELCIANTPRIFSSSRCFTPSTQPVVICSSLWERTAR
jgi:SAC3/GANP family